MYFTRFIGEAAKCKFNGNILITDITVEAFKKNFNGNAAIISTTVEKNIL